MIRVGPAGSSGLGNIEGVKKVARMGLDCMEVEFTYGVRMSVDDARKVGSLAAEKGIILSVHAPYYINLASDDRAKIIASKKRILDSCERAHALGARCIVFHAGFYQKKTAEQTYELINNGISEIQKIIKEKKWKVRLCPEITGKPSQFGSIEEIKRLMATTDLFVLTSSVHPNSHEGFGIVYLEANACGTPVLAARLGGAAEAVEEGVSGLFVQEATVESIVSALNSFFSGEVSFNTEACRAFARRFTWARVVDHASSVYMSLCN